MFQKVYNYQENFKNWHKLLYYFTKKFFSAQQYFKLISLLQVLLDFTRYKFPNLIIKGIIVYIGINKLYLFYCYILFYMVLEGLVIILYYLAVSRNNEVPN